MVGQYTDALVQCWGQTEAPASTTFLSREEMRSPALWSSIGRPVPGVEFSVLVDGEVADDLRPGSTASWSSGRRASPPQLLGAAAEHTDRLLADGWWRTSDVGRFDEEGRIWIIGRASETIITGGTNIQPVELERALEAHASVREAVVVGVPDERWGETPAALVYAPDLVAERAAELLPWMSDRLAGFKRPRHVYVTSSPSRGSRRESKIARGQIKHTLAEWVSAAQVPDHVTKVVQ